MITLTNTNGHTNNIHRSSLIARFSYTIQLTSAGTSHTISSFATRTPEEVRIYENITFLYRRVLYFDSWMLFYYMKTSVLYKREIHPSRRKLLKMVN